MWECKRHPSESQPGGGVCASCLEERLVCLWRGDSFSLGDKSLAPSIAASGSLQSESQKSDAQQFTSIRTGGSSGSVRKDLQANEEEKFSEILSQVSKDIINDMQKDVGALSQSIVMPLNVDTMDGGKSEVALKNVGAPNLHKQNSSIDSVMVEWTAFHARRRRNLSLEFDSLKAMSRSFDSAEPKPSVEVIMASENVRRMPIESNPRVTILKEQKMRSRSMPLENRSAEETALRVIRECQADNLYSDDRDYFAIIEAVQDRDGDGCGGMGSLQSNMAEQGCFSPKWQNSPKWVQVLASPITSRNRVFPTRSKEDIRKGKSSRKRLTRFASSDWSHKDANGAEVSPHWLNEAKTSPRTTRRRSPFSWLQDTDKSRLKKQNESDQLSLSFSSFAITQLGRTDSWVKDLATVGHLHGIAEEHEVVSEEEEVDNLEDINSFGKFLLIAAKREPKAGLTRVSSAVF
ncbi:uncharacterized protein [Physcomitrium patens]|uniref:uncharacterized protein isoform X2 n=1 Tax=Physcomitrium patens TaxID=3218 RepID=UPI0001625288|nr:uncharacterized protein LOC112273384 isoform X2 [Physcomitrium patens]|eukprot:XP_024357859.1 uncharacterized protein LOC112273384 isoform X2 [Physcomitrella patens]